MPLPIALVAACAFAGVAFAIGRWQNTAGPGSIEGEAELRSRILSASRKRGGGFDVTYDPDLYGADNAKLLSDGDDAIHRHTEVQSPDTAVAMARPIAAADIRTLGNAPMIEYTVALARRMQTAHNADTQCPDSSAGKSAQKLCGSGSKYNGDRYRNGNCRSNDDDNDDSDSDDDSDMSI